MSWIKAFDARFSGRSCAFGSDFCGYGFDPAGLCRLATDAVSNVDSARSVLRRLLDRRILLTAAEITGNANLRAVQESWTVATCKGCNRPKFFDPMPSLKFAQAGRRTVAVDGPLAIKIELLSQPVNYFSRDPIGTRYRGRGAR